MTTIKSIENKQYIVNKQYQKNLKKSLKATHDDLSIKVYMKKNTAINERVKINAFYELTSNDHQILVYHISDTYISTFL